MPRRRLLALDLDGTLLRDDKTVAPCDAAAVQAAEARGVVVTLATGRLATGTLPIARELGLTAPMICADGGLVISAASGEVLRRTAIATATVEATLGVFLEHALVPFLFLADAIHCDQAGSLQRRYVETWTKVVTVHPDLGAAQAWRDESTVAMALALGEREAVEAASGALSRACGEELDTVHFAMGSQVVWAVRSLPRGCNKGSALAAVAARLGIPREDVAAVGDWINDVSMFRWAGRSFAMGQAPDPVRAAATDVLAATSSHGGGVAEALDRWLASEG